MKRENFFFSFLREKKGKSLEGGFQNRGEGGVFCVCSLSPSERRRGTKRGRSL